MTRPDLQDLIDNEYDSLPDVMRDLISSDDTVQTIDTIAKKNRLSDEQDIILTKEVLYVFFGVTPLVKFKNILQESLGITDSLALSLGTELYGKIFSHYKDYLKEFPDTDELNGQKKAANAGQRVAEITMKALSDMPDFDGHGSVDTASGSLSHNAILKEIEQPSLSIHTPEEPQQAASQEGSVDLDLGNEAYKKSDISTNSSSKTEQSQAQIRATEQNDAQEINPDSNNTYTQTAGGFVTEEYQNPTTSAARKLDRNLNETVSSVPKEIYHFKRPDPYHESIDD